jgi:hypothetical protein
VYSIGEMEMAPPTDRKEILSALKDAVNNGRILVGAGAGECSVPKGSFVTVVKHLKLSAMHS